MRKGGTEVRDKLDREEANNRKVLSCYYSQVISSYMGLMWGLSLVPSLKDVLPALLLLLLQMFSNHFISPSYLEQLGEESPGLCLSSLPAKQKEKLFNDSASRLFPWK